jgi:hypothetical protein
MLPRASSGNVETVIRGRCDVLFRDRKGFWRPVIVSTDPSLLEADQLRLLLAAEALGRMGKGPGGPPWWVQAGPNVKFLVEARLRASPAAIDEALASWLNHHARADARR